MSSRSSVMDLPTRSSSTSNWRLWAGALLLVYLACTIAGWQRTLYVDEVGPLLLASAPLATAFEVFRIDMVHPPLMYLIERGWLNLFGHTDNAAKALPVVINILTIVLFTWLASRLTRYWRLASFLFGSVYFRLGSIAGMVRMYGLVLLLTVLAIVAWEAWRQKPRTRNLIAWLLVMSVLIYVHYFGGLLLAAFVLANALRGPQRLVFAASAALPALSLLPWLIYLIPVYVSRGLHDNLFWVDSSALALAKLPFSILTSINPGGDWFASNTGAWFPLRSTLIACALAAHALLGLSLLRKRLSDSTSSHWLQGFMVLSGLPVLLLFVFSVFITPAFDSRFLTGILPPYWLLVAIMAERGGVLGVSILRYIFLPWVVLSILYSYQTNSKSHPIRVATTLLDQKMNKDQLILCDEIVGPQTYWEWTRRLGHRDGFEAVLDQDKYMRAVHPEDLFWRAALPEGKLEELDLGGVRGVWLFTKNKVTGNNLESFLLAHGFHKRDVIWSERPVLMHLERDSPVVSKR